MGYLSYYESTPVMSIVGKAKTKIFITKTLTAFFTLKPKTASHTP